jgi:beta-glucosidase
VDAEFLWGAAVSSHQVEGGNDANDWWDWEKTPGHIADRTTSGRASGWWEGLAEADLDRAADLGLTAIRTSLEWSRLEPEPGRFDRAAFDRYRAILGHAKARGMSVLLTLNHFTLPRWVAKLGGWTHRNVPALFEGFADRAVRELGEHVDLWATLNEPMVLAWMGYAGRRWPPGHGSLRACFAALRGMLEAHALAYRAVHRLDDAARVGLVINLPYFAPARGDHVLDRAVAAAQDWAFNGAMLHALRTGTLLPPLALRPTRLSSLPGTVDWLGLNYYGRYDVRFDPRAADKLFGRHVQEPTIRTEDNDWGQPWPPGMTAQLLRLESFGVPLYVTENGICDDRDAQRPRYLMDHVSELERFVASGHDVRGYFHWSLVDNFEWAEGWSARFGLFEVDPESLERRPRSSARVYGAIARARGVTPELRSSDADS